MNAYLAKLAEAKRHRQVSRNDFTWALSFIINALVIHGNTARSGYFGHLTVGIAKESLKAGLCASTVFKTSATYHIQVRAQHCLLACGAYVSL